MANAMRILLVSDEVAPFTNGSEISHLARQLSEQLCESGEYDVRLMMPRYGTISERRNRLHEVIRLSGTEIVAEGKSETLKVKVASIPGVRLQVYFMDSTKYFKRKGILAGKDGSVFDDNPQRALFFGRAVLETISKLGWRPDVVHACGWMSGLVPMLLRTEYAAAPLFEDVKTVYTPDQVDFTAPLTSDLIHAADLQVNGEVTDREPHEIGLTFADAVIYPPSGTPHGEGERFSETEEVRFEEARALYDQVREGVPV